MCSRGIGSTTENGKDWEDKKKAWPGCRIIGFLNFEGNKELVMIMAKLPEELETFHKRVTIGFRQKEGVRKPLRDFLAEVRNHEGGRGMLKFRGWFSRPKNVAEVHFQYTPEEQEIRITGEASDAYQRMVLLVRPDSVSRNDETLRGTYRDGEVKANLGLSDKFDKIEAAFRKGLGIKEPELKIGTHRTSTRLK